MHSSNINCTKSYGPPCLYKVGRNTLIEKQIELLNHVFKNPNIFILAGFKYKKIKNHINYINNVKVIENPIYDKTNDLYSIGLILQYIKNNVLIIQDNILIKVNTFYKFKKNSSQIFINENQKSELGCIINNNELISNISWGLPNYLVNIHYLQNKELELLKYIAINEPTKKWFIAEALNWIIDQGGKLSIKKVSKPLILINK